MRLTTRLVAARRAALQTATCEALEALSELDQHDTASQRIVVQRIANKYGFASPILLSAIASALLVSTN